MEKFGSMMIVAMATVILTLFFIQILSSLVWVKDISGFPWFPINRTPEPVLPTPIIVESTLSPNIVVKYNTSEIYCLGEGSVGYSIIDLSITGGTKPYEFKLEDMNDHMMGPLVIPNEDEPIRLKFYGGKSP